MKGRRVIPALLMSMCMLLSACGSAIPEMNEDQSRQVAEYAAFSLLKYDANNRSRLVSADYDKIVVDYMDYLMGLEPIAPEVTEDESLYVESDPAVSGADSFHPASGEGDVSGTQPEIVDITGNVLDNNGGHEVRSDLFFVELPEGCDLNYTKYEVTEQYVGDVFSTGFGLSASAGKQLLVLHFELSNTSGSDQLIDILNQDLTFKCTLNDSVSRYSLISMLPEDLATYCETLADGQVDEMVLLFEIASEMLESVNSLELSLKSAPKTDTIRLM